LVVQDHNIRIILNPNLTGFSGILIIYGGLDSWPINTEFMGMT